MLALHAIILNLPVTKLPILVYMYKVFGCSIKFPGFVLTQRNGT